MIYKLLGILHLVVSFIYGKEIKNSLNLKDNSIYLKEIKEEDITKNRITFHSDQNYNLLIDNKNKFEFTYKIDKKSFKPISSIWISFFIEDKNQKINFSIFDNSNNKLLFKNKRNKFFSKSIFLKEEEIKIIFENPLNNIPIRLNVFFGCQFCKKDYAGKKDYLNTHKILNPINIKKGNMIYISKMINKNKIYYLKSIKKIHGKLVIWNILEIIVIVFGNLIEIYIINNLIKKKKLY